VLQAVIKTTAIFWRNRFALAKIARVNAPARVTGLTPTQGPIQMSHKIDTQAATRSLHTNGANIQHRVASGLAALLLFITAGCGPGSVDGDGGEVIGEAEETGTGGDGDGDGDPACEGAAPTVTCSEPSDCWASAPSWTAEARATTGDGPGLIVPGIWVPVYLGIDAECWELDGVGTHVCIVDVCGEHLLGTPAAEMALEQPGPECDFTGVWESTMQGGDQCFGLIDGVAVDLRRPAPAPGEMWGPCPITEQGTIDLCNSEDLACVPADDGTASICLPLGGCPDVVPLGLFGELGWGDACYPRCGQGGDCLDGQLCSMADADDGSVCAWPIEVLPEPLAGWCCESFGEGEPVCWPADAPEQCSGLSEWCPNVDGAPACP
jgi:hypothetical protein